MRHRINSPQVISETIQGESIIIHLTTGTYYSLQGSGTAVWEGINQDASVEEIAADVARQYGIDVNVSQPAVEAVVAELLAEDLIVASDAPARTGVATAAAQDGAFQPPKLAKFTDMQDLVLLDPVHEVTEAGWPQTADA